MISSERRANARALPAVCDKSATPLPPHQRWLCERRSALETSKASVAERTFIALRLRLIRPLVLRALHFVQLGGVSVLVLQTGE